MPPRPSENAQSAPARQQQTSGRLHDYLLPVRAASLPRPAMIAVHGVILLAASPQGKTRRATLGLCKRTIPITPTMRKASRQKRAALAEIVFERLSAVEPAPKGELDYVNPFTLLVAVVLSAQATDAGVNKATRSLFAVADTPEKMAALGEEALAERIKTIGLYRSKARHVIALSRAIVDQHGRRDAARPRRARGSARGRPKDRQRRPQHRIRRAHDRGRHPCVPGRQPARDCARQDAARSRGRTDARRPRTVPAPRAPLAHSARALCLQGAEASLRRLRFGRRLPLRAKDHRRFASRERLHRVTGISVVPPPRLERGTSRSTI